MVQNAGSDPKNRQNKRCIRWKIAAICLLKERLFLLEWMDEKDVFCKI